MIMIILMCCLLGGLAPSARLSLLFPDNINDIGYIVLNIVNWFNS